MVDHAAVAQEHDAVGPRGELGVVGDDHAGHAALARVADEPDHVFAVDRVERAGRLVGEQQAALADHGARDRHTLALAAGQLFGVAVGAGREAELIERGQGARARRLVAHAVELERQSDVLRRGQPGQQVEVLEHEPDRSATQARPFARESSPTRAGRRS